MGGAVAVVLAYGSLEWIRTLGAASVPRIAEIAHQRRGAGLHVRASRSVSGLLFGLVPALRLSRVDLQANLKDAGRGSAGAHSVWAGGGNLRRLLVIAELALSVVLLIGAGLLIRSFARLQDVPPGFNPANVLTLELTMTGRKYNDANAVLEAYRQLWERLARACRASPPSGGVSSLPLSQMFAWGPITVEGRTPPAGEEFINADMRMVGGDYFRAMEIPLRQGPLFDEHDTRANPRVTIVDERMASDLWPGEDPIGKRIRTGGLSSTTPWITVIGVVGRVKQYTLDADSRIAMYLPHTQYPHARHECRAARATRRRRRSPAAVRERAAGRSIRICRCTTCGRWTIASPSRWRAAPVRDAVADALRAGRARPGGDRHLRRDGVSGQPGHARAGDSARARRHAAQHRLADRPANRRHRRDRRRRWRRRRRSG